MGRGGLLQGNGCFSNGRGGVAVVAGLVSSSGELVHPL